VLILFTFASENDKSKFEYLYEHYKRLLLHKAYGILHDYTLSEDAVSEAYIRIYKNLHKIDDITSNQTVSFLVTILKNVAITMLQKEKRLTSDELDEEIPDSYQMEEEAIAKYSEEHIFAVIDELNEEYKAVFLLKYAKGLSHAEIADILNTTENNVTVRLHRAKKKLAESLRKEGYDVA
jgi:RNA polymerase sigma-70 factor (ECF subfamily)